MPARVIMPARIPTLDDKTAKPVRITLTLLKKLDACKPHRDIFRTAFPRGVTLTPEVPDAVVDKVVESKLDVDWLAREVLTVPALAEYERVLAPADAEYERVIAAADAEYERARDAAWAEYRCVLAPAEADCERVDAAWAEYQRARDAAWAEYQRARARAAWPLLADRGNWEPGLLA